MTTFCSASVNILPRDSELIPDPNAVNINPIQIFSQGINYTTINVNNSIYWQGHTGTDGSWLTGVPTYNATYNKWAYNMSDGTGNSTFNQTLTDDIYVHKIGRGFIDVNGAGNTFDFILYDGDGVPWNITFGAEMFGGMAPTITSNYGEIRFGGDSIMTDLEVASAGGETAVGLYNNLPAYFNYGLYAPADINTTTKASIYSDNKVGAGGFNGDDGYFGGYYLRGTDGEGGQLTDYDRIIYYDDAGSGNDLYISQSNNIGQTMTITAKYYLTLATAQGGGMGLTYYDVGDVRTYATTTNLNIDSDSFSYNGIGDTGDFEINNADLLVSSAGSNWTNPRILIGSKDFNTGMMNEVQVGGDQWNAFRTGFGGVGQIQFYWPLEIYGNAQNTYGGRVPMHSSSGADAHVILVGTQNARTLLELNHTGSATGNQIEAWRGATQVFNVNATGTATAYGFVDLKNSTINFYMGQVYNKSDAGFEKINILLNDTYYPMTNLTISDGVMNGFSYSNGNLTNQVAGYYSITAIASAEPTNSGEMGMKVFINGTGYDECYAHSDTTINKATLFTIPDCMIKLNANSNISVRFDDHTGAGTPIVLKQARITAKWGMNR